MPVCVAGMHRSGTSMIARLLNRAGLDLGPADQLLPPAPDNPDGFWEHPAFVAVNEAIFSTLSCAWDRPPDPATDWADDDRLAPLFPLATALPAEIGLRDPWGWKDPRTSITLTFWRSLFPETRAVVCVRNPLEVARSLHRRDGTCYLAGLRLWLAYTRPLLTAPDAVFVHYAAVLRDPAGQARRLLERLGLPADGGVCDEVRPAHRHDAISAADLEATGVPEDVRECYEAACRAADWAGTEEPGPLDRDAVRLALQLDLRAEEQHHRIEELEKEIRIRDAILALRDKRIGELADHIGELGQTIAEKTRAVEAFKVKLSARRHRYADRIAELCQKVTGR